MALPPPVELEPPLPAVLVPPLLPAVLVLPLLLVAVESPRRPSRTLVVRPHLPPLLPLKMSGPRRRRWQRSLLLPRSLLVCST